MSNTYITALYHVVWSTKKRYPYLEGKLRYRVHSHIKKLVDKKGLEEPVRLLAVGGVSDHVHILLRMQSAKSVTSLVRFIKSNSSRFVNEINEGKFCFAWQEGYSMLTVSPDRAKTVVRYMKNQELHHAKQGFSREISSFFAMDYVEPL